MLFTSWILSLIFLVGIPSAGLAVDAPNLMELISTPRAFVNEPIRILSARCVTELSGGILCLREVGRSVLQVEAAALGAETLDEIAERLNAPCKGAGALPLRLCRFDIEVTPRDARSESAPVGAGGEQVVRFYSAAIELFEPGRRP